MHAQHEKQNRNKKRNSDHSLQDLKKDKCMWFSIRGQKKSLFSFDKPSPLEQ